MNKILKVTGNALAQPMMIVIYYQILSIITTFYLLFTIKFCSLLLPVVYNLFRCCLSMTGNALTRAKEKNSTDGYRALITIVRHTYIHTYTHTYIHTYMHACMHTHIHTYIHTYMHTCMHACIHVCMHAYCVCV